jgi:hypothetical protein
VRSQLFGVIYVSNVKAFVDPRKYFFCIAVWIQAGPIHTNKFFAKKIYAFLFVAETFEREMGGLYTHKYTYEYIFIKIYSVE